MADDNTTSAESWTTWGKPIVAAIVTSVIVYLQITFFTLTASYMMNRSIYRSGPLRALTGLLAGMTALVTFWVVLFLPKTPYFGMFPMLGAVDDPRWGWLNYFRSSYKPADAPIIAEMVRASLGWKKEMRGDGMTWVNTLGARPLEYVEGMTLPKEGVVNEAQGLAAREAGAESDAAKWKEAFEGIGGIVAAVVPTAVGATMAVRVPASSSASGVSPGETLPSAGAASAGVPPTFETYYRNNFDEQADIMRFGGVGPSEQRVYDALKRKYLETFYSSGATSDILAEISAVPPVYPRRR